LKTTELDYTEIYFDEHKSNYTFIRFTQKCFLDTTMRGIELIKLKLRAHHSHTFAQSSTILLLISITSYKDYDQTSTTTEHSINQPCNESVKFDTK